MKWVAAILSGVAASVITALPLSYFGHGLNQWGALCALLLGLGTVILVLRIVPSGLPVAHPSVWEWIVIGIFTCASVRAFVWLIYLDGDQWKILSPNNLGDLSLHLSFINWMAVTTHWWPASPILLGEPLRYPLGSDLFNTLLLIAGVPVNRGLILCGLGGAALAGYALWQWGRGMALAALLFNGGMSALVLLRGEDPDAVSEWKNLFLTLFVTQRGFLFVLPAGLLLLSAWREENFAYPQKIILPTSVQVLLLGAMPLFSIHTALFFGVVMLAILFLAPATRSRFCKLPLIAWPLMAFSGWLVTTGAGASPAMHSVGWSSGWMSDGTVRFWFWNFGISLPLALILVLLLFRHGESSEARAFVWPAVFVFVCCMTFRFAPWPWDNMKLMLWSWIVMVPYLWSVLLVRRNFMVRAVTLILLFGSGAATLATGLDGRHGYELIKAMQIEETAFLLKSTPPEAVLACAPEFNHPVLLLGHPVVCGYEGHLWSHGLDYKPRLAALNWIMNGEPGWEQMARDLGVSTIYWSALEGARWPNSKLPWAKETAMPSLHPVLR